MIEQITALVRSAPAREPAIVASLLDELRANGTRLALTIARIVEYLDDHLVDPGVALPALAEAIDALVDPGADAASRAAAEYRIATLEPRPDPPAKLAIPDVPLTQLNRGRPPRT